MSWNPNAQPDATVFVVLIKLEQIDQQVLFADAGKLAMKDLQFYNAQASPDLLKLEATQQAHAIDELLINGYAMDYRSPYVEPTAISALVAVMIDGTKTVENLSDEINVVYQL